MSNDAILIKNKLLFNRPRMVDFGQSHTVLSQLSYDDITMQLHPLLPMTMSKKNLKDIPALEPLYWRASSWFLDRDKNSRNVFD
jgi:hypothetical protein